MSEINNTINNLIRKDELPFEVNSSIQQQLNYHLQLKTASSKVKQNAIIPFIGGLLSTKLIGLKVSILTVTLFAFIGYKQINNPSSIHPFADTTSTLKPIDSLGSILADDSLMVY